MALTKECKQEMEHLLTLVERQKQYRTGVVFPSRMNNCLLYTSDAADEL